MRSAYYERALIQHNNESGDPLADILSMYGKKQAENEEPWWYAFWGKYAPTLPEVEVDDEFIRCASQRNETAILVISRVSGGEECDRRVYVDFELTKSEQKLLNQITDSFKHVIVILNTVGIIDTSWIDRSLSEFVDSELTGVVLTEIKTERFQERLSLPKKIMEERHPVEILRTPAGETVLDFGHRPLLLTVCPRFAMPASFWS